MAGTLCRTDTVYLEHQHECLSNIQLETNFTVVKAQYCTADQQLLTLLLLQEVINKRELTSRHSMKEEQQQKLPKNIHFECLQRRSFDVFWYSRNILFKSVL